jgi:hypothetical protein
MQSELELQFMIPSELQGQKSSGSGGNRFRSDGDFELELSSRIRLGCNVVVTAGEFHARASDYGAGGIFNHARHG